MHRSLLAYVALCSLAGCVPPPGSPSLVQTPVTGDWTGTFDSSWGLLQMSATLANEKYSQSIYGSFVLEGQRATGTVGGALQTHDTDTPGLFQGSLTISYPLANGEMCRSTSGVTSGSATERWIEFVTSGFTIGNCPNPPANIRMTLRR
jgi:hypothetical protein